jgi:hypothetical protein
MCADNETFVSWLQHKQCWSSSMQATLSRLTTLFRDVFDDETIVLTARTNADDIERRTTNDVDLSRSARSARRTPASTAWKVASLRVLRTIRVVLTGLQAYQAHECVVSAVARSRQEAVRAGVARPYLRAYESRFAVSLRKRLGNARRVQRPLWRCAGHRRLRSGCTERHGVGWSSM